MVKTTTLAAKNKCLAQSQIPRGALPANASARYRSISRSLTLMQCKRSPIDDHKLVGWPTSLILTLGYFGSRKVAPVSFVPEPNCFLL
jgi:hypothetical protein